MTSKNDDLKQTILDDVVEKVERPVEKAYKEKEEILKKDRENGPKIFLDRERWGEIAESESQLIVFYTQQQLRSRLNEPPSKIFDKALNTALKDTIAGYIDLGIAQNETGAKEVVKQITDSVDTIIGKYAKDIEKATANKTAGPHAENIIREDRQAPSLER